MAVAVAVAPVCVAADVLVVQIHVRESVTLGERARGREGERERGARGKDGERARGREGERERRREGERVKSQTPDMKVLFTRQVHYKCTTSVSVHLTNKNTTSFKTINARMTYRTRKFVWDYPP